MPAAESCGLDWLTQYFDLKNPARHRAGGDAWATAELLLKLLDLARAEGARTFADLEAHAAAQAPQAEEEISDAGADTG